MNKIIPIINRSTLIQILHNGSTNILNVYGENVSLIDAARISTEVSSYIGELNKIPRGNICYDVVEIKDSIKYIYNIDAGDSAVCWVKWKEIREDIVTSIFDNIGIMNIDR